jgi:Domain of unknown function (DUF4260)
MTMIGSTIGAPRLILQAEGAALFAITIFAYAQTGASWWLFVLLFLTPDIFMLGYLANSQLGAASYNLAHTTVLPLALLALGHVLSMPALHGISLIWLAHIGFDRMVGYGLKYPDAFQHTHLGAAAKV